MNGILDAYVALLIDRICAKALYVKIQYAKIYNINIQFDSTTIAFT